VNLRADDSMVIAGGIHPGKAGGQEGELRAVAVVLPRGPKEKLVIVTCDILMITRQELDPAMEEIEKATGIPSSHVLVNCTHTHHAPSAVRVHGYDSNPGFREQVREGIVKAVQEANRNLGEEPSQFLFHLGREETVGQNSRQLMPDGQIYWIGPRDKFVRATGPFDPELPVRAFVSPQKKLQGRASRECAPLRSMDWRLRRSKKSSVVWSAFSRARRDPLMTSSIPRTR
jgi:hypothetical protein